MIPNHIPLRCLCMATNDRPVYDNDDKALNPDKFTNLSPHLRYIHNPKSQHSWQMTKKYQDTFKLPLATFCHDLQNYINNTTFICVTGD